MLNAITLPQWLDDLIFKELKAQYCQQYSDMTNIDNNMEKTLNYLGTYFPRSYAESYCIFSDFFKNNKSDFADKEDFSIFDFGSGTGGEILGLLMVLEECFSNIKSIRIVALDGNQYALNLYEKVIAELQKKVGFQIGNNVAPIRIDDFYDLRILEGVLKRQFDIIISFKAICEFVTKDQFEKNNAYEYIAKFLLPKLADGGLMLLDDITTYNETSQEWLPKMLDKGLNAANCRIVAKNDGYNQVYLITHSKKLNDVSKVAWRMIKK